MLQHCRILFLWIFSGRLTTVSHVEGRKHTNLYRTVHKTKAQHNTNTRKDQRKGVARQLGYASFLLLRRGQRDTPLKLMYVLMETAPQGRSHCRQVNWHTIQTWLAAPMDIAHCILRGSTAGGNNQISRRASGSQNTKLGHWSLRQVHRENHAVGKPGQAEQTTRKARKANWQHIGP